VIATAGFDPLLDEGDAHARRLAEAGVPVRHRRHLELPHGFSALAGVLPRAGDALRALARDLGRML
jgi:acetyl esterase/lipase